MTASTYNGRNDSFDNTTYRMPFISQDFTTNVPELPEDITTSNSVNQNERKLQGGPTKFKQTGLLSKEAYTVFTNTMWFFIVPTLSLIGVSGNICGIWYMIHEKLRQPFHYYLFALMVVDLVFLLMSVLRNSLIIAEYYDTYLADRLSCYYSTKLKHTQSTVYNICAYLITLMSFERLINILFPLRLKLFSARNYTIIFIIIISIINIAFTWPLMMISEPQEKQDPLTGIIKCTSVRSKWAKENNGFLKKYNVVALVIARFIPAAITTAVNVVLCIYLARKHLLRAGLFEKKTRKGGTNEQLKITVTLMILSVGLVLSLVPTATAAILFNYFPNIYGRQGPEYYTQQCARDIGYLARMLSAANDFFIYVMMSKASRNTFKKMIWSACCRLYSDDRVEESESRSTSRIIGTKVSVSTSEGNK